MREQDERSAERVVAPARTSSWPLLRRLAVLLLVLAACLAAMALAAASAGHAAVLSVTRDAALHHVSLRLVGRADFPPRFRPTSPPPALVRTVEDVPGTRDRAPSAVRATVGETPRVLDRTGRGALRGSCPAPTRPKKLTRRVPARSVIAPSSARRPVALGTASPPAPDLPGAASAPPPPIPTRIALDLRATPSKGASATLTPSTLPSPALPSPSAAQRDAVAASGREAASPPLESGIGSILRAGAASASALLTPSVDGLGAGSVLRAAAVLPTNAVQAQGTVLSGMASVVNAVLQPKDADPSDVPTHPGSMASASGDLAAHDWTVVQPAKVDQKPLARSAPPSARGALRAVAGPALTRLRGSRPSPGTDHRMPMPYAPMALASVTAGPAVSSSSAAGPAFPLPQTTDDCQDERVLRLRTELARQPTRTIAQDPGHTPD